MIAIRTALEPEEEEEEEAEAEEDGGEEEGEDSGVKVIKRTLVPKRPGEIKWYMNIATCSC